MTLTTGQADVGRIESAAEADFQHRCVDLVFDEVDERHRRGDFEIGWATGWVAFGGGFFVHRAHDGDHAIHERD